MKIRTDFVTNSSSSSFIIAKKYLDADQIEAIKNHFELAIKLGMIELDDPWMVPWDIEENDRYIAGDVSMDNFSMSQFFKEIGVLPEYVNWGEFPFDIDNPNIPQSHKSESIWRDILHTL